MSPPDGNNKCQNLQDDLQCLFSTETDEVEYQEPFQNNSSFQNLDNEVHKLPENCPEVTSTVRAENNNDPNSLTNSIESKRSKIKLRERSFEDISKKANVSDNQVN